MRHGPLRFAPRAVFTSSAWFDNDLKFKAIMWLIYARETERERESKDEGEEMELD